MKIGIDCRFFSSRFTGIGRYTHELVMHFIRLNSQLKNPHELILFFNDPEYGDFNPACQSRHHSKTPGVPHVRKILVNAPHYSIAEQFIFLKKLNDENLDLVHFPHFNIPILYNKPYIVTIHDLTLSLFPGQKMTKWYHRVGYNLTIKNAVRRAKKIIAVSENTKKDLQKFLHVPAQKISVIYNGISPEFKPTKPVPGNGARPKSSTITPGFSGLSPAESHPFLLYAGVWRSHKNLPRLIEAFRLLKTNFGLPGLHSAHSRKPGNTPPPGLKTLKLVITGNPDPHYPEVKNAVCHLHLQKEVIFPGLVTEKELVKLYNEASIFVFPSLYEGFGLPPLEAMACGTPVAASNSSSIPEICGKNNAIFFDPRDPHDIAAKILHLYNDKSLQQKLIRNGLIHSRKFSWQRTAKTTFGMILDCLKKME